ncbi:MAG: K(+)-transporting ATPase subunit C [Desulfomonile tiedjei]|uniref:Potassium-transporting ATPase KdpC subunit n=1 Tax=Desulfomonile tiedjei TaxID=2358 RepID=A0A9D6V4J6_9BACT|nr:K(+)-transporting ATPase subunit C [Desulfomonile tiedjei]
MKTIAEELRTSIIAILSLVILLCCVYPVVVWAMAQGLFPYQANGSLITLDGKVVGSGLLAQGFADSKYFHPRPSSAGEGYDAANSGGSNLGPTSEKLIDVVARRIADFRTKNGLASDALVPADAVTASASGLDPHISVGNALIQAHRVAKARGLSEEAIKTMIEVHTEGRDLGILGEERVNVLKLNLALDGKL